MRLSARKGVTLVVGLAIALALGAVWVTVVESTAWQSLLWWIRDQQRTLHQALTAALRAVRAEGAPAAWLLIGISLVYGVFHAAGPGHGKAVIATYLGTQPSRLRRGIVLSVLSALMQGVVAIVVVQVCVGLLGLGLRRAEAVGRQVETLSFALVALVGLVLAWRAGRALWRRWQASRKQAGQATSPVMGRGPNTRGLFGDALAAAERRDADQDESTRLNHARWQAFCTDCGSMHGPDRHALETPMSWRALAGVVVSIGIRPCTGAILVLLVAHAMGMQFIGIASVLAMSVGTAAATSALAALTVYVRQAAWRLMTRQRRTSATVGVTVDLLALCGGVLVFVLGASLLHTSSVALSHPLF